MTSIGTASAQRPLGLPVRASGVSDDSGVRQATESLSVDHRASGGNSLNLGGNEPRQMVGDIITHRLSRLACVEAACRAVCDECFLEMHELGGDNRMPDAVRARRAVVVTCRAAGMPYADITSYIVGKRVSHGSGLKQYRAAVRDWDTDEELRYLSRLVARSVMEDHHKRRCPK